MAKRSHSQMVSLPGLLWLLVFLAACGPGVSVSSSTPTPAPQAVLVGTWTGCMFLLFHGAVFHADGTVNLDDYVVHYTFDGTHIKFSSIPQGYNEPMDFSALLSSNNNLLTITPTQGDFCILARTGSSGEQKLISSIVGTWTGGGCTDSLNFPLFHRITFLTDGTFTSDTPSISQVSPNGTYTISQAYSDDSTLGLSFGDSSSELFHWKISAAGTLMLYESGGPRCFLTRL